MLPTVHTPRLSAAVAGDANCDGFLSAADVDAVVAAMFVPSECAGTDVNGDGHVSAADIVADVALLATPVPTPLATPTGPAPVTPTRPSDRRRVRRLAPGPEPRSRPDGERHWLSAGNAGGDGLAHGERNCDPVCDERGDGLANPLGDEWADGEQYGDPVTHDGADSDEHSDEHADRRGYGDQTIPPPTTAAATATRKRRQLSSGDGARCGDQHGNAGGHGDRAAHEHGDADAAADDGAHANKHADEHADVAADGDPESHGDRCPHRHRHGHPDAIGDAYGDADRNADAHDLRGSRAARDVPRHGGYGGVYPVPGYAGVRMQRPTPTPAYENGSGSFARPAAAS